MEKIKINSIRKFLLGLPENTRILISTIIYGSFAGSAAVLFMTLINLIYKKTYIAYSSHSILFFLIASFITIIGTSLIAGFLLFKFDPSAAGSGIPQLKAIYWKEVGFVPFSPIITEIYCGHSQYCRRRKSWTRRAHSFYRRRACFQYCRILWHSKKTEKKCCCCWGCRRIGCCFQCAIGCYNIYS